MHWTDTATVLTNRKYGENSAIARLFTREHGVFGGVIRGAASKTNRGIFQPGNILSATWNARLPEHLGSWKAELLEANAAHIMSDAGRLSALASACAILESALPERHPYPKLYGIFQTSLETLRDGDEWPAAYVKLELAILAESGFGLDLSQCAATGTTEDLIYVSPKSGRAVCREAGEPYQEKLLRLPQFLLPPLPMGERAGVGADDHRKPNKYGSHSLIPNARALRKDSAPAERHLWYYLRDHRLNGHGFRRQHPLSEHYIADFVCLDRHLIIELDGGQHTEQKGYDARRTAFLEREGYRVLRFWNNELFENTSGVLDKILEVLESTSSRKPTPTPTLPPMGGGGNTTAFDRGEVAEHSQADGGNEEILAGLRLTGYFLEHWLLTPHGRKLPAARERLVETITEKHAAEKTVSY